MRPVQRFGLGLVLSLVMLMAQGGVPRDPGHFFDQTLGDFREELDTARQSGKKAILIMFEMDECPFCHRMKQTVLNQPEIQDYFKQHFLVLSVDIEGDVEITDFKGNVTTEKDFAFKGNRVRATPVFAFFDLNGDPIKGARYTGATKGPDEFRWFGEYVVDEVFREMSFTRYKRARLQAN